MRVGWRNREEGVVEGEPAKLDHPSHANSPAEEGLAEPVKSVLDRLATQVHGLQQQLDAFIVRRNEAVAERASHHVAAIVGAAERSAAGMRAAAEAEVAATRENLMADVRAEIERIRAEAETDAAQIRSEALAHALGAREKALMDASGEIQALCGRLSDELQASAGPAVASEIPAHVPPFPPVKCIAEVQEAVDGLQTATAMLEHSLRKGEQAATRQSEPAGSPKAGRV